MLKIRIMPTLLYKDVGLVKGVGFDSWRCVGSAVQSIKVYNIREVDELVFLDITATRENRCPDFGTIDDLADECFMPLTVGGGVQNIEDIRRLLQVGADKVAINTAAVETPLFVQEAARIFGRQCIVISVDVRKTSTGDYKIFTHSGTRVVDKDLIVFVKEMENLGAGEILLTSIERDGTMQGYDIDLIKKVTQAISIPVVASGGAGNYGHMLSAIEEGGASALAAASIFHFTEQTPLEAKLFLSKNGINVRL